jgi:tetratricopeptide (TPR) repeat protein
VVATLVAVVMYYLARADLRRAAQVLESLHAGLKQGRQWFRPAIEAVFGGLAWLRGDFDAAATHLEQGTPGQAAADQQHIDALWFLPDDPIAFAYIHLALTRWVRGDLSGAEAELPHAARRTEQLSFPQGPYSLAYTRFVEIAMRAEAGQLDRAAALAANLIQQGERHGFDNWRLAGANWLAFVEPGVLSAHIATMTTLLDTLRTVGLNVYTPLYDAILARVLIEAARPEQARHRLDTGLQLAEDTGMHFYDAELLRLRAHTHTDPDARQADIDAAVELARRQGATLFELRSALDDFELRGQPAHAALVDVVSRMPTDSAWPELARARAELGMAAPRPGGSDW